MHRIVHSVAVPLRYCMSRSISSTPMAADCSITLPPARPLIVILGATGTGKSNLAIQIAQAFNKSYQSQEKTLCPAHVGAEIVNADAMQLYRDLPVITNKVPSAEQGGIPHHLLDDIGLDCEPWTIQRYVHEADATIQKIRQRGNIPIVVGGTGYYIYGLLFSDALIDGQRQIQTQDMENSRQDEGRLTEQTAAYGKDAALTWPILEADNAQIYAQLQEVDPEIAKRWHPNDRRKIQRSLEIYLRTGKKASEVYDEQKQDIGVATTISSEESTPLSKNLLRYDPLIFWLEADDKVLKDRLNRRVETMIENGLLAEAEEMDRIDRLMQKTDIALDKSKGIWVSIGYKEILPWIAASQHPTTNKKELDNLKHTCIEAVKSSTRQYAKRQSRFIRLRLANALAKAEAIQSLFLLDCTELAKWEANVLNPALRILRLFMHGERLPEPSSLSRLADQTFAGMTPREAAPPRIARRCETCDKVLMTEAEWTQHIHSHSHKKVLQGIRKRELNEARKEAIRAGDTGKTVSDKGDFRPSSPSCNR